MIDLNSSITHFTNPAVLSGSEYSDDQRDIISVEKAQQAISSIRSWPDYAQTPLHYLKDMAKDSNIAAIWYKDESQRFGLKSFKALGGAYAVARQLQNYLEKKLGVQPSITDLLNGKFKKHTADIVVSCATDGNHGRSVAWGAQLFGSKSIIYIHRDVSLGRQRAIEAFNSKVIRVDGNYDESVRKADIEAKKFSRIIVSDTSYEGYMEIPKDVALGYTVMLSEIVEQLNGNRPSHIFIQGGVGGIASAVVGYFSDLWGADSPRFIIVEPIEANCLQRSAIAGKRVTVNGNLDTLMAGLACGEVSELAWKILATGANDFLTISENIIPQVMSLLAKGYKNDPKIEAGESAVPGLGAALVTAQNKKLSKDLSLDNDSKVLVIGTEGATDLELYQQLIK